MESKWNDFVKEYRLKKYSCINGKTVNKKAVKNKNTKYGADNKEESFETKSYAENIKGSEETNNNEKDEEDRKDNLQPQN